jgi:hypothetical protein
MSGFLTLNGTDVPVVRGTRLTERRHGDIGRTVSSAMRTDTIATIRTLDLRTLELTAAEAATIRAILMTAGTVAVGGTIVGDESPAPDFVVVDDVGAEPVTGDAWILSATLEEAVGVAP